MRRSTLWMCALLVTTTLGCEQVKKQAATVGTTVKDQIARLRERFTKKKPEPDPLAARGAANPAAPPTPETPPPAPPPSEPVQRVAVAEPVTHRDRPYVSQDTGTVFPGMGERDVYSLWGAPAAVRHKGEFTYLFFQNGCEYSCGTMDVVTLQNGQVTDAIVRWPGHGYAGVSTSPIGGTPEARPGGNNLQMTPDTVPITPENDSTLPDTVPMTPDPQNEPTTP